MTRRKYVGIGAAVVALLLAAGTLEAQQAPVRVSLTVLQKYVGEYVYPDGNTTLRISLSGDTLFREDPGRRVALRALSDSRFRLVGGLMAEFVTDSTRAVTMILGNGANMEFRLPRKGTRPILPPVASAMPVPKSVLERYVGDYRYIPGQMDRTDLRVFVRLKDGKLSQRMDTAEEMMLIPLSETRFSVSGTLLITEFVIDEAGTTMIMGSDGRQMLARMTGKN